MSDSSDDKWILLIGVFKLVKAAILFAAGFGILRLLHKDIATVLIHWVDVLRVDPDNRYIHAVLEKALSLDKRKLKEISAGTFCYAGLFLTEGTGLLLRKQWAQYFTIYRDRIASSTGNIRNDSPCECRQGANHSH